MKRYIGLDVHSKNTSYCIQDEEGNVVAEGEFPTTPEGISAFVDDHSISAGTRTGLESGTVSFFVARLLTLQGLDAIVIDAHEVRLKAHRSRQKTDRRDAYEICHTLRRVMEHYPARTLHVLDNPRINSTWQDARSGLALNPKRYDIIVSAPLHLRQAGRSIFL